MIDRSQEAAWRAMREGAEKRHARPRPLPHDDGDGTSGGVTDDWKASVEQRLGQLHADLRALLSRGVAAVVALAIMIGGLYLYGNERFDRVAERLTAIEVQQAKIDAKLDQLLERSPKR